jgi:hypothetical protein
MPSPITLPPVLTPQQAVDALSAAAAELLGSVNRAAATGQQGLDTMTGQGLQSLTEAATNFGRKAEAAMADIRLASERSMASLDAATDQASSDFQQLLNDVLNRLGLPAPAGLAIGEVNGDPYFEPAGFFARLITDLQAGRSPVAWTLREPKAANAFRSFLGNGVEEIARKAQQYVLQKVPVLNLPVAGLVAESGAASGGIAATAAALPAAFWILVAVAIVIVAVGVSILVVLIGLAVLFAIYKGYSVVELDTAWDPTGRTGVKGKFQK